MRAIDEIIIHTSATRPEWMEGQTLWAKREEIKRWHKQRGWRDIGYHYLIDRDGTTTHGRPLEQTGAHVKGHNTGTIGICLIGGHGSSEHDDFYENFTPAQDRALRAMLNDLQRRFPSITKITGHNQYAAKACPGFTVSEWLASEPSSEPVRTAEAIQHDDPAEQAGGFLGALLTALAAIFGKGKA